MLQDGCCGSNHCIFVQRRKWPHLLFSNLERKSFPEVSLAWSTCGLETGHMTSLASREQLLSGESEYGWSRRPKRERHLHYESTNPRCLYPLHTPNAFSVTIKMKQDSLLTRNQLTRILKSWGILINWDLPWRPLTHWNCSHILSMAIFVSLKHSLGLVMCHSLTGSIFSP